MNKTISFILMILMFTGCAGTYYSHKKIPIKLDKATANLYGELDGLDLSVDIERCYSNTDECSKILNGIHNIQGINWDNFEINIKEIK